jgi:IS1 family transposase
VGFCEEQKEQRWLWHAIAHKTGEILAYVLSGHKDEAFLRLKELLEPFGITQYYTDGWGLTNDILSQHCMRWVSIILKKSNEST